MALFSAIAYGFAYVGGFLAAASGLSMATAVAIGTAVGQIGTALALSAISRALAPKVNIPVQEIQALIDQADAPRRVYVGRYLAGGVRAFFDVKAGVLYQLVLVNHGRIDGFEEFWIDGAPELVADGAVDSGEMAGYVFVSTRDGSGQGGNYPKLMEEFPAIWDADRRLEGQATFLVRSRAPDAEDFMKVFPKSYNTLFQWVIRGQRVYDPRSGASVWSDNAALVIAHYLRHADGYRLAQSEVDWDSVAAMADWCDLEIPQRAGGTAPNMRLWGYWTLDEEPSQVLERMALSSGIRAYETQSGRIGLIGGPFGIPACTLTARDISQIQTAEAISEREGYNTLQIHHLAPTAKYDIAEVQAWTDPARLAQEGIIAQEMRLEMCPNTSQGRRRGKMRMHDDNRATVEIITDIVGLKARYPAAHGQRHTVLLDYRPEDGSGRVIAGEYEVLDHEFDPKELQCRIKLARVDRASEAWDAATEEGEPPAGATDMAGDPAPPLTAVLTQVVDRGRFATLQVRADAIPDRDDLSIQAQYRKVGDADWIDMTATRFIASSGNVRDGAQYEARARFQGVFSGVAPWHPLGPITVVFDSTPPGQTSELIPSNGIGYVRLSWRNPSTSFATIRIYRGATTSPSNATLIGEAGGVMGQLSEYLDRTVSPSTQYRYWVAAANISGVEGDRAGPATITATA